MLQEILSGIIKYSNLLQSFVDEMTSLYIVYYPLNFFFAFITSYMSFTFYVLNPSKTKTHPSIDDIVRFSKKIEMLEKNLKRNIRFYRINSALLTGLVVSAFIGLQFDKLNWTSSILYGFLGLYALRDPIIKRLQGSLANDLYSEVEDSVNDSKKSYDSAKNSAKEDIRKEIEPFINGGPEKDYD